MDLHLGTAALPERDYIHEAIERSDLIITIGHDTNETPPFIMNGQELETAVRLRLDLVILLIEDDAFEQGGVHLVEVPIDYSENERVLVRELAERLPVVKGVQ